MSIEFIIYEIFNQKIPKFIQRIYKLFIKDPNQLIKFIDNH